MNEPVIPPYHPLKVEVKQSNRNPDLRVAFIESRICFFERNLAQPQINAITDVMITRPMYSTHPKGHHRAGRINTSKMMALIIREIDPTQYTLVSTNGFVKCDKTGRIIAAGTVLETGQPIDMVANKLGVRYSLDPNNLLASYFWVKRDHVDTFNGDLIPVAGLTRMQDGIWSNLTW